MGRFSCFAAVAVLAVVACGGPAPGSPAPAAKDRCSAYLDAPSRPHERPEAIVTFALDDGAPGYEHELLAQVLVDGEVRVVSVQMSAPGPNGLVDREWVPRCGSGRLAPNELAALRETLRRHRICDQKVNHRMWDASAYRVKVRLPDVGECEVFLDHREDDMTPDGRESYRALVAVADRFLPTR